MENHYNLGQLIAETNRDDRDRSKLKEDKKKTKILLGSLIVAIFTFIGFFVFQTILDYQKTERQYQACLEKCDSEFPDKLDYTAFDKPNYRALYNTCIASCKEKYAK